MAGLEAVLVRRDHDGPSGLGAVAGLEAMAAGLEMAGMEVVVLAGMEQIRRDHDGDSGLEIEDRIHP